VSLDSVYERTTGISGVPLQDGYHFGQTIVNDYGRSYGEGVNVVLGTSAHGRGRSPFHSLPVGPAVVIDIVCPK